MKKSLRHQRRSYESRRGEAATAERTMKINKLRLQRRGYFESDEGERDDNFGSELSSDPKRRRTQTPFRESVILEDISW